MRKLSDTIARLAALRQQSAMPGGSMMADRLADMGDFGGNPGGLRARTYVPDDLPAGAPLVVVLHGCTQTAAGYDHGSGWSELADREGFALLFPEQRRANNANLCFNWFVAEDTQRDSGEALSIREMIEAMVLAHGLDGKRIFVTGLSAGGAMANVMLASYPDIFAGGAIIAGLPYGVANTVPEAFDRMRGHGMPSERQLQALLARASSHSGPWPRISIWQGAADRTVDASNADALRRQWAAAHGLKPAAASVQTVDGHRRQVWRDKAGREVLEVYSIGAMGHGTPLQTAGEEGLGNAGPFLLEAGISSTLRIAQFWGIAPAQAARGGRAGAVDRPRSKASSAASAKPRAAAASRKRKDDPPAQGAGSPAGVQKVIEDALRAAGLMR